MPNHLLAYLHNKELNELYASVALRSLAISMIGIFVPLYLLQIGYDFRMVLLYFLLFHGIHALLVIPVAKLGSKIGLKHLVILSMPLLILFYLMLYSLPEYRWGLGILALVRGVGNCLFWVGYHSDFTKHSDHSTRGRQIGIAQSLFKVMNVVGPALGGIIIAGTGFKALFIISGLVIIAASVPLLLSSDTPEPLRFNLKGLFKHQRKRDFFAYTALGIDTSINLVIWPVIMYMILSDYAKIGIVSSIGLFVGFIAVYFISKFSDQHRRLTLRIGGLMNAIVQLARLAVRLPMHVIMVNAAYGISQTAVHIPFNALSYDKAKDRLMKGIVFREISINLGWALFFLPFVIWGGVDYAFIIGALASFFFLFF